MQLQNNHKFNFFKKKSRQEKLPYKTLGLYAVALLALVYSPMSSFSSYTLISILSYLFAVYYGVKGAWCFREYTEHTRELCYPMTLFFLTGTLFALPEFFAPHTIYVVF